MKKQTFLGLILILTIMSLNFTGVAKTAYAPEAHVSAGAYYLYNLDTNEVISERNSTQPMYPASVTKIMTCILALEKTADLDKEMVKYPNYVQDYLYTYQLKNGAISLGGLSAGEEMSMRKLLFALMLPSANEAAMVIADHVGGSQEGFIQMMNDRAKELGATNTNFANPDGLFDENHVTTAEDIAKIAMHAIKLPNFMDIVSETAYDSGPTNKHENLHWETTNKMIIPNSEYFYPGLKGVKTGHLPEAGRCFVSTATRDGFSYLLVVLGSDYLDESGKVLNGNASFVDTKVLYDWVFDSFKVKTLVEKGKIVAEIPLKLSTEQDFVKLMTSDRFSALRHKSEDASSVTLVCEIPDSIDAPIKKYDKIGTAKLMLSGEEIGRVDLLSSESVEASQVLIVLEKVKAIASSFWFKFSIIFAFLLFVAYVVMMISRNRRRQRQSSYRPRRRI